MGKGSGAQTVAAPPNILLCIADDWSAGIKSLYPTLRLPNIARLAREGIVFDHAFTVSPTCAAARAGLLTGQPPHRLEQAANLWGTLAAKFPVYPDLLEAAGYFIGYAKKGYSPAIDGDRGGRLRLDSFSLLISGRSAGCRCDVPYSGWHVGRA